MIIKSKNKEQNLKVEDLSTKYEYQEGILEVIFENKEDEMEFVDRILSDLISRPKRVLFFEEIVVKYKYNNVIYIHGLGEFKKDNLKPICSYIEMIMK